MSKSKCLLGSFMLQKLHQHIPQDTGDFILMLTHQENAWSVQEDKKFEEDPKSLIRIAAKSSLQTLERELRKTMQ